MPLGVVISFGMILFGTTLDTQKKTSGIYIYVYMYNIFS